MGYEVVSDEELLLLIRSGRAGAQEALFHRYYQKRAYHCRRAAPEVYGLVDEWDLNSDYFQVFFKCESCFKFGKSLFKNYFESALRHEIFHAVRLKSRRDRSCFSLDESLSSGEGDLTFHDVIPAYEGEDPRIYLNYVEEAFQLNKAPQAITKDVLAVAICRGENMTYPEIADRLHISVKMCKDRYAKYVKAIKKIVDGGRVEGFCKPPKPKRR
ncbi:MAG: hypothetical protein LKK13_01420 [Bacilli bacterium]|jgi:DNA-directed RNA polymerase specialized sigma24 family protein|nr:hypothetical protein [Bacilli bacterium]